MLENSLVFDVDLNKWTQYQQYKTRVVSKQRLRSGTSRIKDPKIHPRDAQVPVWAARVPCGRLFVSFEETKWTTLQGGNLGDPGHNNP